MMVDVDGRQLSTDHVISRAAKHQTLARQVEGLKRRAYAGHQAKCQAADVWILLLSGFAVFIVPACGWFVSTGTWSREEGSVNNSSAHFHLMPLLNDFHKPRHGNLLLFKFPSHPVLSTYVCYSLIDSSFVFLSHYEQIFLPVLFKIPLSLYALLLSCDVGKTWSI